MDYKHLKFSAYFRPSSFAFQIRKLQQSLLLSIFITFLFGNQTAEHNREIRQRNTASKNRLGMKRATLAALPPNSCDVFSAE